MQVHIRSWCCKLETFVFVLGILQSLVYLLLAIGIISWYLLLNSSDVGGILETIVEISNLTELDPQPDYTNSIILITGLTISFLGLLTSVFCAVAVKIRNRYLLLPWLIFHFCAITSILIAGLYFIINYAVLLEEKDYVKAALSLFLIVFGILFIFIWILVDQLFIHQKFGEALVQKPVTRWQSSQSVTSHIKPWYPDSGTIKSTKSLASTHSLKDTRLPGNKRVYRLQELSIDLTIPKLADQKRMSRSLEYILENGSNNSSTSREKDFKSLPRSRNGKKTRRNPTSVSFNGNSFKSDTLRSSRSVASCKSVTIDPKVQEYTYSTKSSDTQDGGSHLFLESDLSSSHQYIHQFYDEGVTEFRSSPDPRVENMDVPSPVYPRSGSQDRKFPPEPFLSKPRGFTREQIIQKYCDGDVAL